MDGPRGQSGRSKLKTPKASKTAYLQDSQSTRARAHSTWQLVSEQPPRQVTYAWAQLSLKNHIFFSTTTIMIDHLLNLDSLMICSLGSTYVQTDLGCAAFATRSDSLFSVCTMLKSKHKIILFLILTLTQYSVIFTIKQNIWRVSHFIWHRRFSEILTNFWPNPIRRYISSKTR